MQKIRKRPGPPSSYTEAMGDRICARIAAGESLLSICKSEGMPSTDAFYKWLACNVQLSAKYAAAREQQADFYADSIVEIADTEPDPNRARARVDARKWYASKLRPKVYGDKLDIAVTHTLDLSGALDEARQRLAQSSSPLLDITPNPGNAFTSSLSHGDDDSDDATNG